MKVFQTLLLVLFTIDIAFGEQIIAGFVKKGQGEPMLGVNVFLKGTYDRTSTDMKGKFSFKSLEIHPFIIVASFMGYQFYKLNLNY